MNRALRSRRLALVASCAVLGVGLGACGSAEDAAAPSSDLAAVTSAAADEAPAVIVLQSPLGGAGRSDESAAPSTMVAADGFAAGEPGGNMAVADVDYEYAGTPPELAGEATAWRFPVGGVATAEQASRLATALGLSGENVQLTEEQGGGWLVGPADYSAATVNLSSDAVRSWWYNAGPSEAAPMCEDLSVTDPGETLVTEVAPVASSVDPAVSQPAGEPAAVPATNSEAKPEPAVTERGAPVPCAELQPPANLPDEATATASATALLQAVGLDPASYEIEVRTDEWTTSVTASLVLDGVRTNVTTYLAYGEDGELMWAGGALATPERGDVYPLIGVAAGVDRLNEQADSWYGMGSPLARSSGDSGWAETAVVDTVAAEAIETVPAEPVPAETVPIDTMIIEPAPAERVGETIVITLTAARLSLEQQWAADGTVWLLPGYLFDAPDAGWYSVVAIEDQYLEQVEPQDAGVAEPGLAPETLPTVAPESVDVAPVETPATDAVIDD